MKKIVSILIFLFLHYFCIAQSDPETDRIEAIKMAFVTKELNLNPQEAEKFWPVYNSYTNEINQARQQYPNDVVSYEDKVVSIQRKYQGQFKKVLNNNDRVNKVFTSENNYRNLLRNELQRRQQMKQMQNRPQQNRPQQNRQQQNRPPKQRPPQQ
ncbi:MAG: hypothetical protein ACR2FN_02655 [Chitinophagaceae bacterium]